MSNLQKKIVIPGERLYPLSGEYESGGGTFVMHGHIYSTLAGFLHLVPPNKDGQASVVEVRREERSKHSVPVVGAIVTVKRYCKCAILCVEDFILPHQFSGQIRKEDIREKEKDKVDMHLSFRPRDTLLARVISLGDSQSSYQLSTAEDELGVVSGFCEDGHKLSPVRKVWTEMECVACGGKREGRKVAMIPHFNKPRSTHQNLIS